MNTACRLVLGVAVCLTFLPGVVDAQCVTFDDPEELFARADVVFVGTVMASQPTGTNGAHAIVGIATFRVEPADRKVTVLAIFYRP